jgi:hypothetical protein
MGVLAANLKHHYQAWTFRLLWPFGLLMWFALTMTSVETRRGSFAPMLLFAIALGLVLGSYQQYVRSLPFTFLLPGHQPEVRQQALVQSAIYGVVSSLAFLLLLHGPVPCRLRLAVAMLFLSTALCLSASTLAVSVPKIVPGVAFLPVTIVFGSRLSLGAAVSAAIASHPWVWAGLGALAIVKCWLVLGRRDLARRAVLSPSLFLFDAFNLEKAQEYQRQRRSSARILNREPASNALVPICLAGVRSQAPSSLGRYVYAAVYRLFGFITGKTLLAFLPMFVLLPIWLAYTRGGFMLYPFLSMLVVLGHLSKGSVALPVGRRSRLTSGVVHMIGLACLAVSLAWAITTVANLFLPLLPAVTFQGITLKPRLLPTWGPVVVLAVQPLAYAIGVWLRKLRALVFLCWLPLGALAGFFANRKVSLPPLQWVAVIGLALGISLAMLRYHFLRRDLA